MKLGFNQITIEASLCLYKRLLSLLARKRLRSSAAVGDHRRWRRSRKDGLRTLVRTLTNGPFAVLEEDWSNINSPSLTAHQLLGGLKSCQRELAVIKPALRKKLMSPY
ncbi:hypothetical protein ACJJTC_017032 [Scirpophaga incertulas]